jgi:hypothetical protein
MVSVPVAADDCGSGGDGFHVSRTPCISSAIIVRRSVIAIGISTILSIGHASEFD